MVKGVKKSEKISFSKKNLLNLLFAYIKLGYQYGIEGTMNWNTSNFVLSFISIPYEQSIDLTLTYP